MMQAPTPMALCQIFAQMYFKLIFLILFCFFDAEKKNFLNIFQSDFDHLKSSTVFIAASLHFELKKSELPSLLLDDN